MSQTNPAHSSNENEKQNGSAGTDKEQKVIEPGMGGEWHDYRYPGDVQRLKCGHDICCMVLFILIVACFIAIMITGLVMGEPSNLYSPVDEFGQFCGKNNLNIKVNGINADFQRQDLSNYPYLLYAYNNDGTIKTSICVSSCPSTGNIGKLIDSGESCSEEEMICPSYNKVELSPGFSKQNNCTCPYTTKTLFKRCIPIHDSNSKANSKKFDKNVRDDISEVSGFGQSVLSIIDLWVPMLVISLAGAALSFIFVFFLRCIPGCFAYSVMVIVPCLLIVIGVIIFVLGDESGGVGDTTTNKVIGGILWGLAAIVIALVVFCFMKIKPVIEIMKVSAKGVSSNILVIFIPVISMICTILSWVLLIVSTVYNYSAGDLSLINGKMVLEISKPNQYLLIYNLIYAILISVFFYYVNYYAMSGTLVNWFFNGGHTNCCNCNCIYSYLIAWSKGLGTVAALTFVITPLYPFILFMEYLETKIHHDSDHPMTQFFIKCCCCCTKCFEGILRFTSKLSVTVSQIYNVGYWKACRKTVETMTKDVMLTVSINSISTFILFLGKISISGIASLAYFLYVHYNKPDTTAWLLSLFVVFVIAYLVSCFVLNMFDSVTDVLFCCYQANIDIKYDVGHASEIEKMVANLKEKSSYRRIIERKVEQADEEEEDNQQKSKGIEMENAEEEKNEKPSANSEPQPVSTEDNMDPQPNNANEEEEKDASIEEEECTESSGVANQ